MLTRLKEIYNKASNDKKVCLSKYFESYFFSAGKYVQVFSLNIFFILCHHGPTDTDALMVREHYAGIWNRNKNFAHHHHHHRCCCIVAQVTFCPVANRAMKFLTKKFDIWKGSISCRIPIFTQCKRNVSIC